MSVDARAGEKNVSGYAQINGGKLYYEMRGSSVRNLVLIHGGLVDSRLWDDQFKAFAKEFRVLRYDLRGFGRSDFSMGPLSHVDDLYALMKSLRIEKASLIGLSLGSIIAVDFALEHPEMVERLVLTSPGLRGSPHASNKQARLVYKAAEELGMKKAIEMWLDHPFFASGKNNRSYQKRTRRMLEDNFRTWGPTPRPIVWNFPTPNSIERLEQIKHPTLIIAGTSDAENILLNAETLRLKIAGAKKILMVDVSHHLNMEKPLEYNRIVLDFLREH